MGRRRAPPLNCAAEIVPKVDPYRVGVGGTGTSARSSAGAHSPAGRAGGSISTSTPIPVQHLTTDADDPADVRLTDGHWFVAFVHMVKRNAARRWATYRAGPR
jgi:hypothetical protein